jgi:hypothetical protein
MADKPKPIAVVRDSRTGKFVDPREGTRRPEHDRDREVQAAEVAG